MGVFPCRYRTEQLRELNDWNRRIVQMECCMIVCEHYDAFNPNTQLTKGWRRINYAFYRSNISFDLSAWAAFEALPASSLFSIFLLIRDVLSRTLLRRSLFCITLSWISCDIWSTDLVELAELSVASPYLIWSDRYFLAPPIVPETSCWLTGG